MEGILDGKAKYAEKNLSQRQLVHHNYSTDGPGVGPWPPQL